MNKLIKITHFIFLYNMDYEILIMSLYSSTAGLFKLLIAFTFTALAASS